MVNFSKDLKGLQPPGFYRPADKLNEYEKERDEKNKIIKKRKH